MRKRNFFVFKSDQEEIKAFRNLDEYLEDADTKIRPAFLSELPNYPVTEIENYPRTFWVVEDFRNILDYQHGLNFQKSVLSEKI